MENASKAVLIAGAVLIVLIVLGVATIFVLKSDVISKMGMNSISEEEIANHNSLFSMYDGQITGTQVIALVLKVEANNANSDLDVTLQGIAAGNAGTVISSINKTQIYNAQIQYDNRGVLSIITVN